MAQATLTPPMREQEVAAAAPSTWRAGVMGVPWQRVLGIYGTLLVILLLALWLRVFGPSWHAFDWGDGQMVHPDENFIGGLVSNLQYPSSPLDLFNTNSGWNPAISAGLGSPPVDGHPFHGASGFNYGSLPLYLTKIFTSILSWLGSHFSLFSVWQYPDVTLAGRVLSGIFDTITVFLVFLLGRRLRDERTGLLAAAFACFAVLSIQLAHYSTVDSFLGTFATGTILASVSLLDRGRTRDYVLAGIWLAAALATKASAVTLVATVGIAFLLREFRPYKLATWKYILLMLFPVPVAPLIWWQSHATRDQIGGFFARALLLIGSGVVALFLFQPYCFVDWSTFWAGVQGQQDLASGSQIVFYTIKWHGTTPLVYPLAQLTNYSLGIPLALLAYAGLVYEAVRTCTGKRHAGGLVAFFTVSYFISAGLLYMKYLRYMEPIVPVLCALAALPVMALAESSARFVGRACRWAGYLAGGVVLLLSVCYGLAYQNIYAHPLTRVQASTWIYQHIPAGSRIAEGQPDETLPLGLPGKDPGNYPWAGAATPVSTTGDAMPTYDDDSLNKVFTMSEVLVNAQYYFESSRRAIESFDDYGSKYPYMQRFYALLLGSPIGVQDALGYTMVARFVEHPRLGPWTDTEEGANQNFNEYDHPPVEIWQNTGHFSSSQIQQVLTDNGRIQDPTQFLNQPAPMPKSLMLSPKDIATNQQGPTYAQMFPPNSLPMRFPAPVWWLMIEALGLLALPLSMRLFSRLSDAGFVLSKTVAILLLSWFAWILASTGHAVYDRTEIALCLIPIALLSLAWGVPLREIPRLLRARWQAVALTEAVFILGFLGFLWIRAQYPDLWHNWDGGEKTMDFSFLNAIVRSRVMPPYDPWFSGGYLNYYYYGHFTVATLLKLAAITPAVAINLAMPTWFALTLASSVSIAHAVVRRIPFALLAGVLALLAGNLYGAQQLIMDLQAAGPWHDQLHGVTSAGSSIPLLGGVIDAISFLYALVSGALRGAIAAVLGLLAVISGHAPLPSYGFRDWAWAGSRALDNHAIITEFPYWTFLYGDPHAHLWDMPFALCIVAVAFGFAQGAIWRVTPRTGEAASPPRGRLLKVGRFLTGRRGEIVAAVRAPSLGGESAALLSKDAIERTRPLLPGLPVIVWPVIGVLLGAIGPTNPWDLAAMFGILALVVAGRSFWLGNGWLRTVWTLLWQIGLLGIFALGCYLPFYRHFQSFYSHIGWTILRHESPLNDFLSHWGLPMYVLLAYLLTSALTDTNLGLWLRKGVRHALFTMWYWERRDELHRYFALVRRPEHPPRTWQPYWGRRIDTLMIVLSGLALAAATVIVGMPAIGGLVLLAAAALIVLGPLWALVLLGGGGCVLFLVINYGVLALLTGMAALTLLLLIDRRERQESTLMYFHIILLMGLIVAAAGEIVYVRDFYDGDPILFRSNTVFKLYEDAWLLLNISTAIALVRLLLPFLPKRAMVREVQGVPAVWPFGALAVPRRERNGFAVRPIGTWRWLWLGGLVLLLVGAAIYPIRMTPERLNDRHLPGTWPALQAANIGPTLDGMAFLRYVYPDDYAAITWINQTIPGSPVMLTSRYGNYGNFSARVGMFTGLPTVVDWGFEAAQQRYNLQPAPNGQIYPELVGQRERNVVDVIYNTIDPAQALDLLHQYNVGYVYVGVQERGDPLLLSDPNSFHGYDPAGLAKFPVMTTNHQLQLVFSHGAGADCAEPAHPCTAQAVQAAEQPNLSPYAVQIYKVVASGR